MKRILLICALLNVISGFSKENIDSLKTALNLTKSDSIKVEIALIISKEYRNSNPDSALYYAWQAFLFGKKHFPSTITNKAYLCLGITQEIVKNYDSSVYYLNTAIAYAEKYNDPFTLASAYNSMGVVCDKMGLQEKAIACYIKALKQHELNKEDRGIALAYNNLGVMYKKRKQYDKAIEHYQKAWKIYERNHEPSTLVLTNIAGVYYVMRNIPEAIRYLLMAKKVDEQNNNIESLARILNNLTSCYQELNDLTNAIKTNNEAIAFVEKYNNFEEMVNAYDNKAAILSSNKQYSESILFLNKALTTANKISETPRIIDLYKSLSKGYSANHQYEIAAMFALKYADAKDSLMNIENKKQIAEMQAKYESATKDKELLKKDVEIAKEQADSRQKSIERNAFIIAFGLMLLLAFYIFKSYKEKKKAAIEISFQKEIIEQKQKEMLDSIHYAKRIQSSLFPTEKYIDKNLKRLKKDIN